MSGVSKASGTSALYSDVATDEFAAIVTQATMRASAEGSFISIAFCVDPALLGAKHSEKKLRGLSAGVITIGWSAAVNALVVPGVSRPTLCECANLWYLILLTVY